MNADQQANRPPRLPLSSPLGGEAQLQQGVLSLGVLTGTGVAQVAPAIASFFVFGAIVAVSGVGTPFVILLSAVGYLFHVNSNAEFNKKVPSAGFYVTYMGKAFGNAAGAATAFIFTAAEIALGAALFYQIGVWTSTSVQALFHFNLTWWIPAVVMVVLVGTLISLGVRLSVRVTVALFLFEFAVLAAGAIAILVSNSGHITGAGFNPANIANGTSGLGLGFPIAIFLFLGASASAPLAEEARNARRTLPIALFAAAIFTLVTYVLLSWVEGIGFHNNSATLVRAAFPFVTATANALHPLSYVMYVAGFTSATAVMLAAGNATLRVWYNMGREGVLPRWFGVVHPRFRTPHRAVLVFFSVMLVITLALGAGIGASNAFSDTSSFGTIGIVVIFIAINFALTTYYLRQHRGDFRWWRHLVIPAIGTVVFAYPLWESVKPTLPSPSNWFGLGWIVLIALSIVYGILVRARVRLGDHLAEDEEVRTMPPPVGSPS